MTRDPLPAYNLRRALGSRDSTTVAKALDAFLSPSMTREQAFSVAVSVGIMSGKGHEPKSIMDAVERELAR